MKHSNKVTLQKTWSRATGGKENNHQNDQEETLRGTRLIGESHTSPIKSLWKISEIISYKYQLININCQSCCLRIFINNFNSQVKALLYQSQISIIAFLPLIKTDFMWYTHYVKVWGIGRTWVSPHPRRATSLHVNNGGAQTVNVRLCVVSSTQNQFRTHVHLEEKKRKKYDDSLFFGYTLAHV